MTTDSSQKISIGEKIGYSLGDLAANLVFQTLVTYLAYYYVDVYGLETGHATTIIFFVGIFAAFVFNPVMGAIADRTNSKWGKFRPWILWTAVPLGIISLLTFSTPDFSYSGKIFYAVITYSLLLMLYAANNLPYAALSGVITSDMGERNSISSFRFVAVMLAQFFVQVFMYDLIFKFGDGDKAVGMGRLMTVLAIVGTVLLLITFFTTRERVIPKPEQKSSVMQDLKDLFKNVPWVIMLSLTTLIFITLALKGGSYVYYFENYVDQVELQAFLMPVDAFWKALGISFESAKTIGVGMFNASGILCMIVGIAFSKQLADKFGKRDIFGIFLFVSTIFILLFLFFPSESVGLMFLSQALHGFFYGITIPILWAMIADVADYSEWKNNRRATAIIFSAMMVGLKLGLAIGGALVSGILGAYDYDASLAEQGMQQAPGTITGIKLLVSVYPSIPFFIGAGLLFFYEINKKMEVQIEEDLYARRNGNDENV